MSELPNDRVTLKVYTQPLKELQVHTEELHSDSMLDTASLTTYPDGSPSPACCVQLLQESSGIFSISADQMTPFLCLYSYLNISFVSVCPKQWVETNHMLKAISLFTIFLKRFQRSKISKRCEVL